METYPNTSQRGSEKGKLFGPKDVGVRFEMEVEWCDLALKQLSSAATEVPTEVSQ